MERPAGREPRGSLIILLKACCERPKLRNRVRMTLFPGVPEG